MSLASMKGMGLAKATQIAAAMELGRRVAISTFQERPQIRSPEDVYNLLHAHLLFEKRGAFHRRAVRHQKTACYAPKPSPSATLDSSLVHPREVYRAAIREGAACWIAAHNHPSGDPTPSPEDIAITQRLRDAGALLGIELLDHIIIGDGRYTSFRERGLL
jgi:DNA repair protein RadC